MATERKCNKKAAIIGTIVGIIVAVIVIPCTVCSFRSVPPNYYGLNFNNIKKSLNNEKVYTTGRYGIGVSSNFLLFPSTIVKVSRDDIKITDKTTSYSFAISVLYTINKDDLPSIYRVYKNPENLNSMLSTNIQTALVAYCPTATKYEDYFNQRTSLEQQFVDVLKPVFEKAYCEVVDVQLRTVTYIANIEAQLISYPTTQLQGKLATLNGEVTNMRQQIAATTATNTAAIQSLNADNDALIRKNRAENDAKIIAAESESSSYRARKLVKGSAGGEGESTGLFESNEYVKYEKLAATPTLAKAGSRVVINVPYS